MYGWIGELFASLMRYLANRNSPEGLKEAARVRKEKKLKEAVKEVDKAIDGVKEVEVNNLVDKLLIYIIVGSLLVGCTTPPRPPVPQGGIVYLELKGEPGWWVPKEKFRKMLLKLEKCKNEELER